jgi:uncharacterized protein YukE
MTKNTHKRPIAMAEKDIVDRAIEIEERMGKCQKEIDRLSLRWDYLNNYGGDTRGVEALLEDIESELSDLQKEYRA